MRRLSNFNKIICLFLVGLIPLVSFSQEQKDPTVVAFSLNAWKQQQGTANIDFKEKILPFNVVWGAFLDESNDIIIVGERTFSTEEGDEICDKPFVTLDQVAVALRTRDDISDWKTNPGVSIEPFNQKDLERLGKEAIRHHQKVQFSGDIEGSDYGLITLEADILLKLMGEGFILPGIEGLPREFDLILDNFKSARRTEPLEGVYNRSWFFPTKINYNKDTIGTTSVSVSSVLVEVNNEFTRYVDLPIQEGLIPLTPELIQQKLNKDPLLASPLYSIFLSQYMDSLQLNYPVLRELKNVFSLSGIFLNLIEQESYLNQQYWEHVYPVTDMNIPSEIPALYNSENGLGYSYSISGGLSVEFEVRTDTWTRGLRSRYPEKIKEGALASRPSPEAVSWIIPAGFGKPAKWNTQLIDSLVNEEREFEQWLRQHHPNGRCPGLLAKLLEYPEAIENNSWQPDTKGKDVIAFSGNAFVSSEEGEYSGYSGYWRVGKTDMKAGVNLDFQWVFDNWVSLRLNLPLVAKLQITDVPSLPGITNVVAEFNGGIENVTLTNKVLLFDGLDGRNRWRYPQVILENTVELPLYYEAFSGYILGRDEAESVNIELPFGRDNWFLTNGIHLMVPLQTSPLSRVKYLRLFGAYVNNLEKGNTEAQQIILDGSILFPFRSPQNLFGGARVSTSLLSTGNPFNKTIVPGVKCLAFISVPEKNGSNTFGFGWMFINSDWRSLRGGPILQFNLSGHRLWDARKWYR